MTKTVLVTGGTRGLGLTTVRCLLQHGYSVVATGRHPSDALTELMMTDQSTRVSFASLELNDHSTLREFVQTLTKDHGDLYALVNNAAIGRDGVLATMHESEIVNMVNINVTGTILLTKYASRSMLLRGEGRIINIASIIGHTGFTGLAAYAATKGALLSMTKSLARELGRMKITVNSISPGFMETDMTSKIGEDKLEQVRRRSPSRKLADPSDVAETIAFLLSESAASITGTDIVVDAGSTA